MADLSVQQQQQLSLYLKKNPKVSREKAINLLFGGGAIAPLAKGLRWNTIQVRQSHK